MQGSNGVGALPTFIVIGAMKCGTTSLYHYLRLHPEISMSALREPNFFVSRTERFRGRWERGLAWYQSQFDAVPRVRGEVSPQYTFAPLTAQASLRMHSILPEAKIIYLLRDPVQRLISHYQHLLSNGHETRPLHVCLANPEDTPYVQVSRYFYQLEPYISRYDRSRMLLIEQEKLRSDRRSVLEQLFQFLEVDPDFWTPAYNQEHHRTTDKRMVGKLGRLYVRFIEYRIRRWLPETSLDALRHPFKTEPLTAASSAEEIDQRIRSLLARDVDQLREWSQMAFSGWSL